MTGSPPAARQRHRPASDGIANPAAMEQLVHKGPTAVKELLLNKLWPCGGHEEEKGLFATLFCNFLLPLHKPPIQP